MSRYYSVLVITVVVINGLHCIFLDKYMSPISMKHSGHQNIDIIKLPTFDPSLDLISVVHHYTPKCPLLLPVPM